MTRSRASLPVDLLNPGQVFACLGLLEAADLLCGEAVGGYDCSRPRNVRFELEALGSQSPVAVVLDFLSKSTVRTIAPPDCGLTTQPWDVPTDVLDVGAPFPFPTPSSPATLPAVLFAGTDAPGLRTPVSVVIDHWGDATKRDNVKFWAGAGGFPGAGLARDAVRLLPTRTAAVSDDPFAVSAPQTSSFRFDWRRDYVPMNVGFSPNDHTDMTMIGFPLVELLAAIGLTHARPQRPHRANKLAYRYGVVACGDPVELLGPLFHRVALGCGTLPFAMRTFQIALGWPGKEGQARSIIAVTEETAP